MFDDCKANDPQFVGWKEKGHPNDPYLKNNILFSLLGGIQIITVHKQPWGNDRNGMGELIKHKNQNKYTVGPIQQSGHSWALAEICFGRIGNFGLHLRAPKLLNWPNVFTFKLRWRIIHVLSSIFQLSPPEFTSTWQKMASVDPPLGY